VNDNAQTFLDPEAPFTLRIKSSTVGDNGLLVKLFGGRDPNGLEYFDSVSLTITSGSPANTTRQYSVLPMINKAVTTGQVDLYSVDTLAVETQIATYAPGETIPAYKRYRINNWIDSQTTVELALCKLAYVPVVADTDIVVPGIYGALKHGLKALSYEDTSDDNQDASWTRAYKVLNDDRHQLDGEVTMTVNVSPQFGAGSICNVM
jgi:hypothetical protein